MHFVIRKSSPGGRTIVAGAFQALESGFLCNPARRADEAAEKTRLVRLPGGNRKIDADRWLKPLATTVRPPGEKFTLVATAIGPASLQAD